MPLMNTWTLTFDYFVQNWKVFDYELPWWFIVR